LTANLGADYLAELRGREEIGFLSDLRIPGALYVPELILPSEGEEEERLPRIRPDRAEIILYTSGTTGKPKAVRQRLTELEADNRFILSRWGPEILARKVCSTVSWHHVYGLLFSVLLPFTAGVPFRRGRIEHPEELEAFTDDSYVLITVPGFLKRAVELEGSGGKVLSLKAPWIFTSGGALSPETGAETERVFGFWPWEIYGSTETNGLGYRQTKQGLGWHPFEGVEIRITSEGRLAVRSPYMRDPAEFETGDEAEIQADGTFILKGRADGVVKIEEKRVSLAEVEGRLLQSGLVEAGAVIPLEDRRQYLAGAVVLNSAGKEHFAGWEKQRMNRYFREYLGGFFEPLLIPKKWRYVEALPGDSQGKRGRTELRALFDLGIRDLTGLRLLEKGPGKVIAEIFLPETSGYFDGHFPAFKIFPGVAQVEVALRLGDRYFNTGLLVARAKRLKFSGPIFPNRTIRLDLSYYPGVLAFRITSPDGKQVYSAGALEFFLKA
jgi:acyl-coenzyme A synthetase/AMP-(fatty) acid ligase